MKLKELIQDRLEVSYSQFCKEIKVSRPTIDNIVNEKNKHTPSLLTIKKICKYFGVEPKDYI